MGFEPTTLSLWDRLATIAPIYLAWKWRNLYTKYLFPIYKNTKEKTRKKNWKKMWNVFFITGTLKEHSTGTYGTHTQRRTLNFMSEWAPSFSNVNEIIAITQVFKMYEKRHLSLSYKTELSSPRIKKKLPLNSALFPYAFPGENTAYRWGNKCISYSHLLPVVASDLKKNPLSDQFAFWCFPGGSNLSEDRVKEKSW